MTKKEMIKVKHEQAYLNSLQIDKNDKDNEVLIYATARKGFIEGWDARDKLDNEALNLAVEVLEYYQKGQCTWIDGSINIAPATKALTEILKLTGEVK